jgi:hypothetical protein
MAYNRQPQTVLAGVALKQNPLPSIVQPAGIVPVTLDANIATTTSLGVVKIGSGLSIAVDGTLSSTSTGLENVKLTSVSYTATANDYFIGATKKDITITLPLGVIGKTYAIKNQVTGNITVNTTATQKIDGSLTHNLEVNKSIIVIFDGTQWNILANNN